MTALDYRREVCMKFILHYEGRLPSTGNNYDKHVIRTAFHPQLKRLWSVEPALIGDDGERIRAICFGDDGQFVRAGFNFLPLVTSSLHLVCNLNILIDRQEAPGSLVRHGGDIDNRIKTLFDCLRVPDANQLTGMAPGEDQDPFCCLLSDDALITGFDVNAERLLEPKGDPSIVKLRITCLVKPTHVTGNNLWFLGGW